MRLLIELSSRRQEWDSALSPSEETPRLPLPYSCTTAFLSRGHEVAALNFTTSSSSREKLDKGAFEKIYEPDALQCALDENDLAFFWARSGIRAIAVSRRNRPAEKKILLGSYVWGAPAKSNWRVHRLDLVTRLAARFARGVVVMTEEQRLRATRTLGRKTPVIKFVWGIDSGFYRRESCQYNLEPEMREQLKKILSNPYVILLGDQQRTEDDAIQLVEHFGINLVRVPQEKDTAQWYREQISSRNLRDRLFVFEHVNYPTLRFLLQNAMAYVGLVDSTWQPAGWTVLCEALASGTPSVVYDGLTAREMRNLGAGSYLNIVSHGDVAGVAAACRQLRDQSERRFELSQRSRDFAAEILDLEKTGRSFVQDVERLLGGNSRYINAVLANPGTQHSLHLARELDRRLVLKIFYTGLAWRSGGVFDLAARLTSARLSRRLENRICALNHGKLRRRSRIELGALWDLKRKRDELRVMHRRNEIFQLSIPDEVFRSADVTIGTDTASWILAKRVRAMGRPFLLDQTIGHSRSKARVYETIRSRFPNWANDLESPNDALKATEDAEHQDATHIIAASSFTKQTLVENGVSEDKIVLNPYGVDLDRFSINHSAKTDRPFRFLFAGLVCARKGIPLLLEAWKRLQPKDAELWIVGPLTPTAATMCRGEDQIKIVGKVPNSELATIMAESDVFVFPSYFEGFGLVLLEAMAAGLAGITTTATAGPDIVTEGADGFIIEPGDLDTLVGRMEFCLHNRDRVAEMGVRARRTAERFSWSAYGDRWMEILRNVIGQ